MRIRLSYFGALKDLAGAASQVDVDVPEGSTAADLWSHIRVQHPALEKYARSIAIAVNHEYAEPSRPLRDNDEVALLPPVSGGAPEAQTKTEVALPLETPHAKLQREPIDADRLMREIKAGEDGAVCTFDGIVRNNTRGRRTLHLEYDSYPQMAVNEMEKLAVQALEKFAIRDVRIVHRVGCLQIKDSSVLIVVASAHRGAAFDACRWIIDTLKKTVPVWKKEFFEDGAVWADGEPFPPEIGTV